MQNIQTIANATNMMKEGQILNHGGGVSYRRSLREQVLQVLSTNTLNDTFYVKKEQLALETIDVLMKAREKDPWFLAQAIVWARQHGLMKSAPIWALAILSGRKGLHKELFRKTFIKTILTPDDLRTFVECIKVGAAPGRVGLGGIVRDCVAGWIGNISEYHTVKYGSTKSEGVTLRDIVRMTHPKPASDTENERLGWLVKGSLRRNMKLNPSLHRFEALKKADTEKRQIFLVKAGKLPFEVVVPSVPKMTVGLWTELLHNAPYMNLLRSLNTFQKNGVFDTEANVDYAVAKLTDPVAVSRSRVLPFRFFDAWKAYTSTNSFKAEIADALRAALELSFQNLPDFGKERHVTLGIDVSGSMDEKVSEKGQTRFVDIAGIFAGALLKHAPKSLVLPFQDRVLLGPQFSRRDDVLITAEKIARLANNGTALGAPIQHLLDRKIKTDVFIGITDNEDWAYGNSYCTRGSFLELWRDYKKENPKAIAFVVTIDPNRCASAPDGEEGVHFIYGWSDKVLQYISSKLSSGLGQVESVSKIEL
jgi:60 kDa SS-A/Ro ribonucleoprotein